MAIKAGRKITNIWSRLAKNIMRNEQQYDRCEDIAECDYRLSESYRPDISPIYSRKSEATEEDNSQVFLWNILFHDMHTGNL